MKEPSETIVPQDVGTADVPSDQDDGAFAVLRPTAAATPSAPAQSSAGGRRKRGRSASLIGGGGRPGAGVARFLIRDQSQPRTAKGVRKFATFTDALAARVGAWKHPIIEPIDARVPVCIVDIDTHGWAAQADPAALSAWVRDVRPEPQFWWITHGNGVRLVYEAVDLKAAQEVAAAAALSWPVRGCTIELKRETRHPSGAHPSYPGVSAGPVGRTTAPPAYPRRAATFADGQPNGAEVAAFLAAQGFVVGSRYAHCRCPIAPSELRSDTPVVVYDRGLICFACEGHGRSYPGAARPGHVPFDLLIGGRASAHLVTAADQKVHWTHQRLVMRHHYRDFGLSDGIHRLVYAAVLADRGWPKDPRVAAVFNPDLAIVRSEDGRWLREGDLRDARVTNDTLRALPWTQGSHGPTRGTGRRRSAPPPPELKKTNGPRLDRAADVGRLDGYAPVRPVQAVLLRPDAVPADVVPVVLPRATDALPISVPRRSPMPEADAFAELATTFPGIDERFVKALVVGAACAEAGRDRPPMLLAHGPSGSGKGATVTVVNGLLGGAGGIDLVLDQEEEPFLRALGTMLSDGSKFLRIAEVARVPRLRQKLGPLLALSETVAWRPLYGRLTSTPFRALLVLNALAPPPELVGSPELCRRIRSLGLPSAVPEWSGRSSRGLARWRDVSDRNALAADSLITHYLTFARARNFDWETASDAMGLCRLADEDGALDTAALRDLYEHICGRRGVRQLSGCARYPGAKGWIDLDSAAARPIVGRLLPDHEQTSTGLRAARRALARDLEAADWPRILRLPAGARIKIEVRSHGTNFSGRFVEPGHPKGHEPRNEQLPRAQAAVLDVTTTAPPIGAEKLNDTSDMTDVTGSVEDGHEARPDQSTSGQDQPVQDSQNCHIQELRRLGEVAEKARRGHGGQDAAPRTGGPGMAVLASADFPTTLVTLDFPTYHDRRYSLDQLGGVRFVADPRFRVHGVCVVRAGVVTFELDARRVVDELTAEFGDGWPGVSIGMGDAAIGARILQRHFGIRPRRLLCANSLSALVQGHRGPGDAGSRETPALARVDNDPTLGVRELDGAQLVAAREAWCARAEQIHHDLERLLPLAPRPEVELPLIAHTARTGIDRAIRFDRAGAASLAAEIKLDVETKAAATTLDVSGLRSDTTFLATMAEVLRRAGRADLDREPPAAAPTSAAKTEAWMQSAVADADPTVRALAQARVVAMAAPGKLKLLDGLISLDRAHGGIPPMLKYHAAHTGRWSGAGSGVNLHGLPKRADGLSRSIRSLLYAREGRTFVGVDLAAIEPRILAWLVGEPALMRAFGEGRDVYAEFAAKLFGIDENPAGGVPDGASAIPVATHRVVGKAAILGLGYRMGSKRFFEQLQALPARDNTEAGAVFTPKFAVAVVRRYRAEHTRIVSAWGDLETAAQRAIAGCGDIDVGRLRVRFDGADLFIETPAGRRLRYPAARLVEMHREIESLDEEGRPRTHLITGQQLQAQMPDLRTFHGGLLLENVVQALARDVLADCILRLEARSLEVMLHVHDEVLVEVAACEAEAASQIAMSELRAPPAWAPDLPLDAKCWIGDCYR